MYLWAVGRGQMTMHGPLGVCLRYMQHYPQLQKHMLYTMVNLNPMVDDTWMVFDFIVMFHGIFDQV